MAPLSVVIICKNNKNVLERTLHSLQGLTDDVLVYDNGSTDNSPTLARDAGARVVEGDWLGFGPTKNKANSLAKYDWILSLDADEAIDDDLFNSLKQLDYEKRGVVYDLRFKNYVGDQWLRYGDWGSDHHIRLFHRGEVKWNDAAVHEQLLIPAGIAIGKLTGAVLHRTTESATEYRKKVEGYARMSAHKYFEQGKKPTWIKLYLSPVFTFIRDYIFKRGFLDGATGYQIAMITAWYTRRKYLELAKLRSGQNQ